MLMGDSLSQHKLSNLLGGDHYRIEALFNKLAKYNIEKKHKEIVDSFNILKHELLKHFKIEEEVIFKVIKRKQLESYDFIPKLIMEHDQILEVLNDFQNNLAVNNDINTNKLRSLLFKHKKFEDKTFYPKLDQELTQNQDKLIKLKLKNKFRKEYKL
jgi:iron-sulfur cluster repair protein YtfE (RIC family)